MKGELWGHGFNQFSQIDDTVEDVSASKCVERVEGIIEVIWAGWADLLCISPFMRAR
jgi:hypothetical protein